jgi:hypothetical protein
MEKMVMVHHRGKHGKYIFMLSKRQITSAKPAT